MTFPSPKRLLLRMAERLGYVIERRTDAPTVTTRWGSTIAAPWLEPQFDAAVMAPIRERTLVTPDRCYVLRQLVRHCASLEGEVAECGVYKGGTAHLLASELAEGAPAKSLFLFDTFTGMPATANRAQDGHAEGDFGDTSLASVTAYLADYRNVQLYPGRIPESLAPVANVSFAFVHVDVDLRQSVRDCCEFFYPRLVRGGIALFDDYGFTYYEDAAKKAVDEFMAGKPEQLLALGTGQAMVIKL